MKKTSWKVPPGKTSMMRRKKKNDRQNSRWARLHSQMRVGDIFCRGKRREPDGLEGTCNLSARESESSEASNVHVQLRCINCSSIKETMVQGDKKQQSSCTKSRYTVVSLDSSPGTRYGTT